MKSDDFILLSTADWNNPFWTNKQHVAVSLIRFNNRVFYIDSLGLRRPTASSSDITRIVNRIIRALKPPREVRPNLWVWSPIVLPFQKYALVRNINRFVLSVWLNFWLKKLNFKQPILWTYNPLTTTLLHVDQFRLVVYHCVDEVKAQPGMPYSILESRESDLCRKADYVFVTSKELYRSRSLFNPNTYYFSNVVDFDHFNSVLKMGSEKPDDMKKISKTVIGFIGAISSYKLDFELIAYCAEHCQDLDFVFIGKVGEGDPWTSIKSLECLSNVHFLGAKEYKDLPKYLNAMKVAILPNKINEYTKSMFPMKFFEYLAAGKPIVSVSLDAIKDYCDYCFISNDYAGFVNNIYSACKDSEKNMLKRIKVASEHTYNSRTKKMLNIIKGDL